MQNHFDRKALRQASSGCLENFKKRHEIISKKVSGKGTSVDENVCSDWKSQLNTSYLCSTYFNKSPNKIINENTK